MRILRSVTHTCMIRGGGQEERSGRQEGRTISVESRCLLPDPRKLWKNNQASHRHHHLHLATRAPAIRFMPSLRSDHRPPPHPHKGPISSGDSVLRVTCTTAKTLGVFRARHLLPSSRPTICWGPSQSLVENEPQRTCAHTDVAPRCREPERSSFFFNPLGPQ